MNKIFFCICCLTILFFSCEKDSFTTDPNKVLEFSVDTLTIDTVFTSVGSTTKIFKIYNRHSESVRISDIRFANEAQTAFKINVDGVSGKSFSNIDIPAYDSLYVFSEVTVDPTNANNPFIFEEALQFTTNGSRQFVVLRAWAQNAYFHYGQVIIEDTVWPTDKPHVVVGKTENNILTPGVVIPRGVTLTIPAKSRVHFTTNAGILCAGRLKVEGTKEDTVIFRGIRLTKNYIHGAGQWIGLLFLRESVGNILNYCVVDESIYGIFMGFDPEQKFENWTDNNRSSITIKNSTIKNSYYWAIRSYNNRVTAVNSVFYTCTENLCQLVMGGDYDFKHCSFYNGYGELKTPLLALSNQFYYKPSGTTYKRNLKARFVNCVWGNDSYGESLLLFMNGAVDSNYTFENCVYRSDSSFKTSRFINCKITASHGFKSTGSDREDLRLKVGSPCIDAGLRIDTILNDMDDRPRPAGAEVDIGAFESF